MTRKLEEAEATQPDGEYEPAALGPRMRHSPGGSDVEAGRAGSSTAEPISRYESRAPKDAGA